MCWTRGRSSSESNNPDQFTSLVNRDTVELTPPIFRTTVCRSEIVTVVVVLKAANVRLNPWCTSSWVCRTGQNPTSTHWNTPHITRISIYGRRYLFLCSLKQLYNCTKCFGGSGLFSIRSERNLCIVSTIWFTPFACSSVIVKNLGTFSGSWWISPMSFIFNSWHLVASVLTVKCDSTNTD